MPNHPAVVARPRFVGAGPFVVRVSISIANTPYQHSNRARIPTVSDTIRIARPILTKMLEESRRNPTHESCGLLAGKDAAITAIFPAHNSLASPTAYEIATRELFSIFREIRAQGLELLAIYHSHPTTGNFPSPTDVARAYYPDAAYFIVSPAPNAPNPIRAFRIQNKIVTEVSIEEFL